MSDKKIEFDDLRAVVHELRSENGCPWDKEQDKHTIKNFLLDETHEIIQAIENEDYENLKEELGDVMFQLLFLAQLAEEKGHFTIDDSIAAAHKKFIRRHPHVFKDECANDLSSDEVLKLWDDIKKGEKGRDGKKDILADVSKTLPALLRAQEVSRRAGSVGFDWREVSEIADKMDEEVRELREAITSGDRVHIEEELGDIIFSVVNVCRFLKINPENALNRTTNKFIKRFKHVQERAGYDFTDKGIDELENYWKEAKEK